MKLDKRWSDQRAAVNVSRHRGRPVVAWKIELAGEQYGGLIKLDGIDQADEAMVEALRQMLDVYGRLGAEA